MFKLVKRIIILSFFLLIITGAVCVSLLSAPLNLSAERVEFHIAAGSHLRQVAKEIAAAGVDLHPWSLILLARLQGVDTSIKAGSYEITQGINLQELLQKLTRGDVTQAEIVFIEGWTLSQVRERLDAHPDLQHATKGKSNYEIMGLVQDFAAQNNAKLNNKSAEISPPNDLISDNLEGFLFPDTYLFSKQSSDIAVMARAYRAMQRHLQREWAAKDPGLPYRNDYEALIMASIVEKETGRDQDRPLVAAVFANRLKNGMLLQTDPTVIYGMGKNFDGNIRKHDLQTDTPYNTYTRAGLPPTPIAMPGLASIQATLHPAKSTALYFVAKGDGSSHFSATLSEHNQAVNRYIRRRVSQDAAQK